MAKSLPKNLKPFLAHGWHLDYLDLEVYVGDYCNVNDWFGRDGKDFRPYFEIVMQDPTGGMFALWDENGKITKDSPVVFLDSEGGYYVVARNYDEMLSLVASGYWLYSLVQGEEYHFRNGEEPEEDSERDQYHEELVAWFRKHDVEPAKNPLGVVAAAQKAVSRFVPWIQEMTPPDD